MMNIYAQINERIKGAKSNEILESKILKKKPWN